MICKFVIGQRVVCLAKSWATFGSAPAPTQPQHGKIYQIAEITADPVPAGNGKRYSPGEHGAFVRLREFGDTWFTQSSFRPLQEKPKEADTDISVFYPLLKTVGPKELVQ